MVIKACPSISTLPDPVVTLGVAAALVVLMLLAFTLELLFLSLIAAYYLVHGLYRTTPTQPFLPAGFVYFICLVDILLLLGYRLIQVAYELMIIIDAGHAHPRLDVFLKTLQVFVPVKFQLLQSLTLLFQLAGT